MASQGTFIGSIIMFGGNFSIRNFAECNGQLINISQNSALFSILGTTYGGDGRTTFALPDLRGRAPIHMGRGPGLTSHIIGQKSGSETVTLTASQLPPHNHSLYGSATDANAEEVASSYFANSSSDEAVYGQGDSVNVAMDHRSIGNAGGGQSVYNMQPYLVINYQIALFGLYPSRN